MGKKGKGGRRKRIVITPKRVVRAGVVIDGLRRIATADYSTASWYVHNKPMQLLGAAWKDQAFTGKLVQPALGVAEVLGGPKVVDAVAAFASKGEPMLGRLANAKLVKV